MTAKQPTNRKQLTQPAEWWDAFEKQAKRDGYTGVSEWLGALGVAALDRDLSKGLPERRGRGKHQKSEKNN